MWDDARDNLHHRAGYVDGNGIFGGFLLGNGDSKMMPPYGELQGMQVEINRLREERDAWKLSASEWEKLSKDHSESNDEFRQENFELRNQLDALKRSMAEWEKVARIKADDDVKHCEEILKLRAELAAHRATAERLQKLLDEHISNDIAKSVIANSNATPPIRVSRETPSPAQFADLEAEVREMAEQVSDITSRLQKLEKTPTDTDSDLPKYLPKCHDCETPAIYHYGTVDVCGNCYGNRIKRAKSGGEK
jgi:hypothetical protein